MAERLTTIRRAVPGDAAALAELGARTFRDAFEADNTPESGFEDRGERAFILGTDRQADRVMALALQSAGPRSEGID